MAGRLFTAVVVDGVVVDIVRNGGSLGGAAEKKPDSDQWMGVSESVSESSEI